MPRAGGLHQSRRKYTTELAARGVSQHKRWDVCAVLSRSYTLASCVRMASITLL